MHIRTSFLILLLMTALCAGPTYAQRSARVVGEATLGVQHYNGESGGETQESSSIYQQYMIKLYQQGNFYNNRAGSYTLMAGYELNFLNPTVEYNGVRDPDVTAIDTSKFYYKGQITIAPGGLPFRLYLFASDTKQSTFIDNDSSGEYATGGQSGSGGSSVNGHLIAPNVYTELRNGTHRTFGGTLLFGIRNGSYLGAYRDVLSQIPRLLIDYKQQRVTDLHSNYKADYLSRDLAFVSLNKKDNWVHFRMRDYVDFINPGSNSESKQVMIGTIDHLLSRKWINLTNWIQLSTDFSYTIEKDVNDTPERTYLLNLMAIGTRQDIKSTVLSSFSRLAEGAYIDYAAQVPITVTVDLDRDTWMRSRFIFEGEKRAIAEGATIIDPYARGASSNQDIYLDSQLELLRSRRVVIRPRIEIETINNSGSQHGQAMRIGTELFSNRRLDKAVSWLAGYALTTTRVSNDTDDSRMFIQNEVYGRVDRELSRTFRVGGSSSLKVGSGDRNERLGFRIQTMSGRMEGVTSVTDSEALSSDYDGLISQGNLNLYLHHRYQRLSNRLDYNFVFFTADKIIEQRNSLRHTLSYSKTTQRLEWQSGLRIGDGAGSPRSISTTYVSGKYNDGGSASWDSQINYHYDPTRSVGLSLGGAINGEKGDTVRTGYSFSEELRYRIFTSNGVVRRLAEFTETLGYEKVSESIDGRDSSLYARVGASYFPTRYFYGRVSSEIVNYLSSSTTQQIAFAEVGLDFQKLKIVANFSEGSKGRESAQLPDVKERRWEVKAKKIF